MILSIVGYVLITPGDDNSNIMVWLVVSCGFLFSAIPGDDLIDLYVWNELQCNHQLGSNWNFVLSIAYGE